MASGEQVMGKPNSHLRPEVAPLLEEALAMIYSRGRCFVLEELDFGRVIGGSVCVATGPDDYILYARRHNRGGHSRFVTNREPIPSSKLVVILRRSDTDPRLYILITAWIGDKSEPEPWDTRAFAATEDPIFAENRSRDFWSRHALIYDEKLVIPGTEIGYCPWNKEG
jgi:hypothetical protein